MRLTEHAVLKVIMLCYSNKLLGMIDNSPKLIEDIMTINRYLLKVMQQVEEGSNEDIGSSVAYLRSPLWSSKTVINPNDYCRLFESRSQL